MDHDPGYPRLVEGRTLHTQRRWAAAERAYREAIAAGRVDGWLFLGLVLQPWPGRETEAEAAFRAAMADDNPEFSARAANELGHMLLRLEGDLAGARECFAFAVERGSGRTRESATLTLAHILGAEGDREGAADGFRSVAAERFRAAGIEVGDDELRRFASAMAGLTLRPRLRRLLRRDHAARYRRVRIRRRLFPRRPTRPPLGPDQPRVELDGVLDGVTDGRRPDDVLVQLLERVAGRPAAASCSSRRRDRPEPGVSTCARSRELTRQKLN